MNGTLCLGGVLHGKRTHYTRPIIYAAREYYPDWSAIAFDPCKRAELDIYERIGAYYVERQLLHRNLGALLSALDDALMARPLECPRCRMIQT